MIGQYVNGCGKVRKFYESGSEDSLAMIAVHKKLFGTVLLGTFNVHVGRGNVVFPLPTYRAADVSFFYAEISNDEQTLPCWAYRWDGSGMPAAGYLELFSKELIPDSFKTGNIKVELPELWELDKVKEWSKKFGEATWHQGFWWLPKQRTDSLATWKHIVGDVRGGFSGKRVLDFGSHTGYFTFKAAREGAIALGVEKQVELVHRSKFIRRHIEQADAEFAVGDKIPDDHYDIIFALSVYHWIDPGYEKLEDFLKEIREKSKVAYLELINPPPSRKMDAREVDRLVGLYEGRGIRRYKHPLRGMRTLWRVG